MRALLILVCVTACDAPSLRILSVTQWFNNQSIGITRCSYALAPVGTCSTEPLEVCDDAPIPGNGAGPVTISDGVERVVWDIESGAYRSDGATGWLTGPAITASAPGSPDMPGFTLTSVPAAPQAVTWPPHNSVLPNDEPLTVTWRGPATMLQIVELWQAGRTLSCLVDSTEGTFTLTREQYATIVRSEPQVQICVNGLNTVGREVVGWWFESTYQSIGPCVAVTIR